MITKLLRAFLNPRIIVECCGEDVFRLVEQQERGKGREKQTKTIMECYLLSDTKTTLAFKIDMHAPTYIGERPSGFKEIGELRLRSCCDFAILLHQGKKMDFILVELVKRLPQDTTGLRNKVEQLVMGRVAVNNLMEYVHQYSPGERPVVNFSFFLLYNEGRKTLKYQKNSFAEDISRRHSRSMVIHLDETGEEHDYCEYGMPGKSVHVLFIPVDDEMILPTTQILKDYDKAVMKAKSETVPAPNLN